MARERWPTGAARWRPRAGSGGAAGRPNPCYSGTDHVHIDGSPAWREENVCHVGTIILEDGTTLSEYDGRPTAEEVSGGLVSEDAARSRPARLPNGRPNLRGPWVSTQASLDLPAVEPTPEGARLAEGRVRHFDSPALRCEPTNIVYDWAFERESNDIHQDDGPGHLAIWLPGPRKDDPPGPVRASGGHRTERHRPFHRLVGGRHAGRRHRRVHAGRARATWTGRDSACTATGGTSWSGSG